MCDVLYVQTQHDIFFIDWEQPRTLKGGDDDDEAARSASVGDVDGRALPVSVWRSVLWRTSG